MPVTEQFIESLALDEAGILKRVSEGLQISTPQVKAVLGLFAEDCTVPFIARYRKEATGSLDETQIRDIEHLNKSIVNLETRRLEIIRGIFGQGMLTDELLVNIHACHTLAELEDIYAPYKRKKKTRGMKAVEAGLEPLAELMSGAAKDAEIAEAAKNYINEEHAVLTPENALQGAMDIIAERFSQDIDARTEVRAFVMKHGQLSVTGNKEQETSTYGMYYGYKEPLSTVKPHRVLAVNRGEKEEELAASIEIDEEGLNNTALARYKPGNSYHRNALTDGMKRLMAPAVFREIRSNFTDEADRHGITLFSVNLQNLLLSPPIKRTRILAVDPGIRTGSKVVSLDENGKYLEYFTFSNHSPAEAKTKIAAALQKHQIQLIAVGNGTGSMDVQEIVTQVIEQYKLDIPYTVVSEDGASVYSASPIAKEEFPDLDVSIRGAISIGRRLLDPLAELVKIDPQSIGVGLYQHDLNQKSLSESLDETVESVVNRVGVNLNTASYSLLRYVSGIKLNLAKKIVSYRDAHGAFQSRTDLLKVDGMGDKTYQQAAGFLKVPESAEALDKTWVHPENYALAREILTAGKPDSAQREAWKTAYHVGDATIDDILLELQKPARDPREGFPGPIMQKGVKTFEDLHVGMSVTGKIKNVVDFGAFVDLGIKETALLHLSEMSDSYVAHAMDVVKVGDIITAKIIDMDEKRRRIGLSMKTVPGSRPVRSERPQGEHRPARDDSRKPRTADNRPKQEERPKNGPAHSAAQAYNPFAALLKDTKKK